MRFEKHYHLSHATLGTIERCLIAIAGPCACGVLLGLTSEQFRFTLFLNWVRCVADEIGAPYPAYSQKAICAPQNVMSAFITHAPVSFDVPKFGATMRNNPRGFRSFLHSWNEMIIPRLLVLTGITGSC
jgi:hypothetical protein